MAVTAAEAPIEVWLPEVRTSEDYADAIKKAAT
jgi:hypothetical protein